MKKRTDSDDPTSNLTLLMEGSEDSLMRIKLMRFYKNIVVSPSFKFFVLVTVAVVSVLNYYSLSSCLLLFPFRLQTDIHNNRVTRWIDHRVDLVTKRCGRSEVRGGWDVTDDMGSGHLKEHLFTQRKLFS